MKKLPAHTDHPLAKVLQERIAIIDGAMGTTIRGYGMKEADIRGTRFKDARTDLLNNGDLFSLTQGDMIGDIHRRFLEAGADIIETNTFSATSIGQSEFFVEDPRETGGRKDPEFYQKVVDNTFLDDLAWEINEQSGRIARTWADRVANKDGKQRFVAGVIGPLTVSLSTSPDADDAGFRVTTFDQVKKAYTHQVKALIAGGVDTLMVETIFDALNAKAALVAIEEVMTERIAAGLPTLPIQISAAVGRGGETMISAQTVEAMWTAVEHVNPLSVGLNCSLGPELMLPFVELLSKKPMWPFQAIPTRACPTRWRPPALTICRWTWASKRRPMGRPASLTSSAAAAATPQSTSRPWRRPWTACPPGNPCLQAWVLWPGRQNQRRRPGRPGIIQTCQELHPGVAKAGACAGGYCPVAFAVRRKQRRG